MHGGGATAAETSRVQLQCARCARSPLRHTPSAYECVCGARFPIVDGIPRFVDSERYSESFGFQWNRFARTQLDSAGGRQISRRTLVEKTGWSLESLAGRSVLDAGCGMGRFAEVCAEAGAAVHGVDLSVAVDVAAANLRHRPNVRLYQADIMNLPFAESSFDFIYSIGVLHHTPDTRAAFGRLPGLLKPGGQLAVWVYSSRLRLFIGSTLLRLVTPRLPARWLLQACRVAMPLYHLHRVPILGRITTVLLNTSLHPEAEWRWLDTFDWYAPRFQWKHTFEEVERWFHDAGLTDVRRGSVPVSVRGTRPVGTGCV
jgi:SAM-dependent methyltransferase